MWPAPQKQVEREKRDTPAITILGIERPLGFELIDHLEPKQRKKNGGSYEPPRKKFRAGRFVETGANEQGFHLCGSVAAWEQVASLWDGRAGSVEPTKRINFRSHRWRPITGFMLAVAGERARRANTWRSEKQRICFPKKSY